MAATSENKNKIALLLVAFGTSATGVNKTFVGFEASIKEKFPVLDIFWSYTSKSVRLKLKDRGEEVLSPVEAIKLMLEQDYQKIAVQSLHIVPGSEYDNLQKTVEYFKQMPGNKEKITLAQPLLSNHLSMVNVAKALVADLPADRSSNDPVVFMGHGTSHEANVYYPAMQFYFKQTDSNVFIATIEGYPLLYDILPQLREYDSKKIWLIPFLVTAGFHVNMDMNGKSSSWRTILEKEGFEVYVSLKGIIDNLQIKDIWINDIKELLGKDHIRS